MADERPTNGNGFTQKDMLVRIESKVESLTQTVAAKHAGYDVEIALLKARMDEREREDREQNAALEDAEERTRGIVTRQNIAAGAIAIIVFVSPLIWILVNRLVSR